MSKVYDLAKEGDKWSPLPLGKMQRRSLEGAVLRTVKNVPAGPSMVMSCYRKERTVWDIPPLNPGDYQGVTLTVCGYDVELPNDPYKDYMLMMNTFIKHGWDRPFMEKLYRRIGVLADNELVISREGVVKFAIDYTVLMLGRFNGGLLSAESTFATLIPNKDMLSPVGIVDGEVIGTDYKITPNDLYEYVLLTRGQVTTQYYGVYDRLLAWSDEAFLEIDDVDKFRTAVTLLKLSQDHTKPFCPFEVKFEQAIRNAREKPIKKAFVAQMSYDKFTEIRETWVNRNSRRPEDKFQDLFEALVPDYYDSEKFSKMFGVMPKLDLELTPKDFVKIDKGIERFTVEFARTKEK